MPAIVSGTLTFFKDTTAPTGGTKSTTNTDYTLRYIKYGATGGAITNSLDFSTTMVDGKSFPGSVSSTTGVSSDDPADLPAHTHPYSGVYGPTVTAPATYATSPAFKSVITNLNNGSPLVNFSPGGTGGTHSHTISASTGSSFSGTGNFAVKYVDFILASKN